MKYLLILLLTVCQQTIAQKTLNELLTQYNTRSVPYISVEGLRALQLNEEIMILDTREPSEFAVSAIKDASCVGYNNFSVDAVSEKITQKDTPIVVYCSLGIRSEEIGEKLKKAGFTNVKNLYGGIFEWKNKGYPVLDQKKQETDSVHVFSRAWGKWLKAGTPVYGAETKEEIEKKGAY